MQIARFVASKVNEKMRRAAPAVLRPSGDSFIRITSLQSLPGLELENPRSLTIGSDAWLPTIIVLQS
jgi:hypothetical protein